jgi:hypothetical protein
MPKSVVIVEVNRRYSLSSPRLTSKTVSQGIWKLEALCNFRLYEDGCALVAFVGVLLVDRGVMLLRVIAALHDA